MIDVTEVARAREAYNNAKTELASVEGRLQKEKEALSKDWGREWEFKKLDGTCIEKDMGE
jgi:outer membrane protein TolC